MHPSFKTRPRDDRPRQAVPVLLLLFASWVTPVIAQESKPDATGPSGPSPLEGRVLDSDARPVSGATITIRPVSEGDDKPRSAFRSVVVRSGEDGRFSGGDVTGTRFDVRIQAEGYAFRTRQWTGEDGPLTVTLERGYELTGRVLAKTTGEGIADARVEIDDGEEFEFGAGHEATTDNEGRYRFLHAPAGSIWVRATRPGWARRSIRGEIHASRAKDRPTVLDDLWLRKGGVVSGQVVDTKGRPVIGADLVIAAVDLRREGQGFLFSHMETSSDETGRYEFSGVMAGVRYRVRARHDSYSPVATEPFAVEAGAELSDVDLTLGTGTTLRLKLLDTEDRPCTRATIRFESEEETRSNLAFPSFERSTETDGISVGEDGWLTVERVPPGRYTIRIEPRDRVELRRRGVVLTEGEPSSLGTIELDPGSTMQGRVVDESGKSVPLAEVFVRWQNMTGRYERRTTSDSEGRFSFGGLPGHRLKLQVSANEFAERNLEEVQAGSDEVVVTLGRRGGIRGTVRLAEGGATSSFTVQVYDDRQFLLRSPQTEIEAGAFEVRDLVPGTYRVEIRASGKAPGRHEKVVVRSGETTDTGRIALRPGLTLVGRVTVADGGAAVAGATVRIDRGGGPPRWTEATGQLVTVSDTRGNFEFDGLDAGRFKLTLFHPEFAPTQRSIDLEAEVPKTEIEIGMSAGGEIRGVVIDADGLPVTGAGLLIYRGSRAFDLRMTSTAEDGTFRFPRLSAGTYIIMRNRSSFNRPVKTIDLRDGQVKQVTFTDGAD